MKRNNKGFSLVELIIVIAIMAILAAAIAPAIIRYIAKSRKGVDVETAKTFYDAAALAMVEDELYHDVDNAGNDTGFMGDAGTPISVQDDIGNSYDITVICYMTPVPIGDGALYPINANTEAFTEYVGLTMGVGDSSKKSKTIKVKYKKDSGKGTPTTWLVVRREDNSTCEIWLGGNSTTPMYKLYPNPEKEYQ